MDCLLHKCLDIVLKPLKIVASIGVMLSDPLGYLQYCFTPLAGCIVNMPEAATLTCVSGKTSHITLAANADFGDPYQHQICNARHMS